MEPKLFTPKGSTSNETDFYFLVHGTENIPSYFIKDIFTARYQLTFYYFIYFILYYLPIKINVCESFNMSNGDCLIMLRYLVPYNKCRVNNPSHTLKYFVECYLFSVLFVMNILHIDIHNNMYYDYSNLGTNMAFKKSYH